MHACSRHDVHTHAVQRPLCVCPRRVRPSCACPRCTCPRCACPRCACPRSACPPCSSSSQAGQAHVMHAHAVHINAVHTKFLVTLKQRFAKSAIVLKPIFSVLIATCPLNFFFFFLIVFGGPEAPFCIYSPLPPLRGQP
jgi:hypothetical protein